MAELVAASDPSLPPMVPLPNIKEGGVPHGGVFPQWSFFNIPFVSGCHFLNLYLFFSSVRGLNSFIQKAPSHQLNGAVG